MSFTELKKQITQLTPVQLDEIEATISVARKQQIAPETAQMLAARRAWLDEVMRGEWRMEFPYYEENQAKDREVEAEMQARWND